MKHQDGSARVGAVGIDREAEVADIQNLRLYIQDALTDS